MSKCESVFDRSIGTAKEFSHHPWNKLCIERPGTGHVEAAKIPEASVYKDTIGLDMVSKKQMPFQ
jgi:hypothetical protein